MTTVARHGKISAATVSEILQTHNRVYVMYTAHRRSSSLLHNSAELCALLNSSELSSALSPL